MQFTMLRDSDDEFLSALQSLKSQETDLIRKPEARHTLDQKECIVPFRVSPRASCNLVLCITVLNAHFILSTFTPHRVSHASNCALSGLVVRIVYGAPSISERYVCNLIWYVELSTLRPVLISRKPASVASRIVPTSCPRGVYFGSPTITLNAAVSIIAGSGRQVNVSLVRPS